MPMTWIQRKAVCESVACLKSITDNVSALGISAVPASQLRFRYPRCPVHQTGLFINQDAVVYTDAIGYDAGIEFPYSA